MALRDQEALPGDGHELHVIATWKQLLHVAERSKIARRQASKPRGSAAEADVSQYN